MAVLKIVSKLYQEKKISEKLKGKKYLWLRLEKQNTITGYTNFFSIQIYSVLQILTMKRENAYGVS